MPKLVQSRTASIHSTFAVIKQEAVLKVKYRAAFLVNFLTNFSGQ